MLKSVETWSRKLILERAHICIEFTASARNYQGRSVLFSCTFRNTCFYILLVWSWRKALQCETRRPWAFFIPFSLELSTGSRCSMPFRVIIMPVTPRVSEVNVVHDLAVSLSNSSNNIRTHCQDLTSPHLWNRPIEYVTYRIFTWDYA